EAAADLATHERSQGNRLRTLQRAVHFACVATHVHAQALAAGGELPKRPPALIAMSGHRRSEIALASERSLDNVYERFGRWLADRLAERIENGAPVTGTERLGRVDSVDLRKIRPLLAQVGASKKPHGEPDAETLQARVADFEVARQQLSGAKPAWV